MKSFIEKINDYNNNLCYTRYRFDKISNFLTFEEYREEKVKKYAKSLIEQPVMHSILDREDRGVSWEEVESLGKESVYRSIRIVTKDGKHWGMPAYAIEEWMTYNKYTREDVVSKELK